MATAQKMTQKQLEDLADIDLTLMTLRKPTELKKVIDSVPKPIRAVPKYGLPVWYKLGLESKLPMPVIPAGKIIFSRGKIGEDVRRVGLGTDDNKQPTFDLTDPYCNNVSYDYVAVHDPHLANYFAQRPARKRMQSLGFCTKDGRAVCNLKEFNTYRKYLYNQFMDRIHMAMKELDERARDEFVMKRVKVDVARRQRLFNKAEKARELMEKAEREHAEEFEAKKRQAKEHEKKIKLRMKMLEENNIRQRKERAAKAAEKENRIKQRVQAAAEIELRRQITMVRAWRANEKKRVDRLKAEREAKLKRLEDQANKKWFARINAQNAKIQEEQLLLKLYTEDMAAGAARREKQVQKLVDNTYLNLQKIRLANSKAKRAGSAIGQGLVTKMGLEFEKSKRGAKGMTPELAQDLAAEAMTNACSTKGDPLMTLGSARIRMDVLTVLPSAPIRILEDILESVVIEFARRRVHIALRDVELLVRERAAVVFFSNFRPQPKPKKWGSQPPRWLIQAVERNRKHTGQDRGQHVTFLSEVTDYSFEYDPEEGEPYKSIRSRRPTPMPSMMKLTEVTFGDRLEDLPQPVNHGRRLPERQLLLKMVDAATRLLTKHASNVVRNGMDIVTGTVTMPSYISKHPMEWGEVVESLSNAVVNDRIRHDCKEIICTGEFLAHRILKSLSAEMKYEKKLQKTLGETLEALEGVKKTHQIKRTAKA